jgi:pimeloyl-ACP methyl ester carboxylesterase
MHRTGRLSIFALSAVLVLLVVGTSPATASPSTCGTGMDTTTSGTLGDGATYLIQCPATWNGTLFLYSHGYVTPGSPNPATDTGDPTTGNWLLQHGYALAGSSYASTGWAVQSALTDQIATLDTFEGRFGRPSRTIAWGHSLGGMITAALVQDHPDDFSGALPFCGVLAGGIATWNTGLDAAVAFKELLAPASPLQVVDITNPAVNLADAEAALDAAQSTPQGRARIALVAALGDVPGWFTPGSPEPAPNDSTDEEANQYLWASRVDFPFLFSLRANLEAMAGGNPSWDTGVNFASQLERSSDHAEVSTLYRAAGLDLDTDLSRLQRAPKISANPSSVRYLARNFSYNGQIDIPVLTVHTTGDGLVVPENEEAYADAVAAAGDQRNLRQLFVARAGHCSFTPGETIVAIQTLLSRIATGSWSISALRPAKLNAAVTALGPLYGDGAAFTTYDPPPYLRPSLLPRRPRQDSNLRRRD